MLGHDMGLDLRYWPLVMPDESLREEPTDPPSQRHWRRVDRIASSDSAAIMLPRPQADRHAVSRSWQSVLHLGHACHVEVRRLLGAGEPGHLADAGFSSER